MPAAATTPCRSKEPSSPQAAPPGRCATAIAACPPEDWRCIIARRAPFARGLKKSSGPKTPLPLPRHATARSFQSQTPVHLAVIAANVKRYCRLQGARAILEIPGEVHDLGTSSPLNRRCSKRDDPCLRHSVRRFTPFRRIKGYPRAQVSKHFGAIKRGFYSCSLTLPLAHSTFDPERMRWIDP